MDAKRARDLIETHRLTWIARFGSWNPPFCDMVVYSEKEGNKIVNYTYNYLMGIIRVEDLLNELNIPTEP